jgi:hypothetical protein
MGRTCSTHGEKRDAYRILVGKPGRKRSLGRHGHRWDDNIKMDLREDGLMWARNPAVIRTALICLRIGTSGGLL